MSKIKIKENKNFSKKKIIGMVHGVFDVIHIGHIKYFEEAKNNCDYLIASVTHNKFVRNKSPDKPIFNHNERISVLRSLRFFDQVILSEDETAVKNIKKFKPNLYFKGLDYKNIKDTSGNLNKEIKEVKKNKGSIYFTTTKLYSSSKIINNKFEYISQSTKEYLKSKNLNRIKNKISKIKNIKKNILVYGEPIIDGYEYVKPSGKSNKATIISTIKHFSKNYGGGVILVSNLLNDYIKNTNLLYLSNKNNFYLIKKYLDTKVKRIPIKSNIKIIKKTRFIDNYSSTKLFQVTDNETLLLDKIDKNKLKNFLLKNISKFDYFFVFDYGYNHIFNELLPIFKKNKKKLIVNCQSNSYNFGFNRAEKYLNTEILGLDEPEFRLLLNEKTQDIKQLILKNKKRFKNINTLIITTGKNGCHIFSKEKYHFVPSIIKNMKDTTGCGDVFLTIFGILYISKLFNVEEIGIISHIAAGVHGSFLGNNKNIDLIKLIQITKNILNV